ncbi:MAG TPA: flavodoxin domain-containing protein [Hyphomicrobiales bacterium]|jgi:menaquinone-dependent protoporphyrinogen oxidase
MKVLIVYASSEGQTRKIAEYIAAQFQKGGCATVVHDSASSLRGIDVDAFDAFLLAGSVHNHAHQASIVGFATAYARVLNAIPSAFLSVSLSAAMKGGERDAKRYVDAFIRETGWQPRDVLMVPGALRYSEYDYFRQQIVKTIVHEKGDQFDAEADHEFTDWREIDRFTQSVLVKMGSYA